MKPEDLLLADVLDFQPSQGIIRLHEQRVVILSATAWGLMRKELIDTLGVETARRLLLRFGFADGYHDAVDLRDRSNWVDPIEGLRAGAGLQGLEGIVRRATSGSDLASDGVLAQASRAVRSPGPDAVFPVPCSNRSP